MDNDKAKQEISLVGRLLCMETVLLLMGLFSLGSGIHTGESTQLLFGVIITIGAVVLYFVRKKDWKAHWEEEERLKLAREERERRAKGEGDERKR